MVKVSVLMPVYNTDEKFLRRAIESILEQTYHDFEFLIMNDCSSDPRVEDVVLSYEDKRIRYIKNSNNLGISGARNKLIELARGEYLAVMDHDDVSLPERLQKEADYLDEHPEIGVVGCAVRYIGTSKFRRLPEDDNELREALVFYSPFCHPATMIRKSVLQKNKIVYEAAFSPAEDYALWSRLMGVTKFANLPEVLFEYRDYAGNTTHSQKGKMQAATRRIQQNIRQTYPELWKAAKENADWIKRIKLFGFLPFLTIRKKHQIKEAKLFGFVPLWSEKIKYSAGGGK